MSDLVKRLRKVEPDAPGERTRWYRNPDGPEAADRIEQLETAFGELMKAWEFWQSQETKNGFSELCAAYWDAKAALAGDNVSRETSPGPNGSAGKTPLDMA